MSKICRTFAAENERIMKKMYNKPEIEVAKVHSLYAIMEGSLTQGDPLNPGDPPAWGD